MPGRETGEAQQEDQQQQLQGQGQASTQTETQTRMLLEQPTAVPGGTGKAYDGLVTTSSAGLQIVEGLAVLAAVPAIISAGEDIRGDVFPQGMGADVRGSRERRLCRVVRATYGALGFPMGVSRGVMGAHCFASRCWPGIWWTRSPKNMFHDKIL